MKKFYSALTGLILAGNFYLANAQTIIVATTYPNFQQLNFGDTVFFPKQVVGTMGNPVQVRVDNLGANPISIFDFYPSYTSEFQASGGAPTLNMGDMADLVYYFWPKTHLSSAHVQQLTIQTGPGGNPFIFFLKGYDLAAQTITFNPLPAVPANTSSTINLNTYASTTSGLPLTFTSSNHSVATVSGSLLTVVGSGSTVITASQKGDSITYGAAQNVTQTLTVNPVAQSITFDALPTVYLGALPFSLEATTSSGLPVSYQSSNTAVATIDGETITIVGSGTATITAKQAGSTIYSAAADVPQLLTVKLSQSISFAPIADVTVGDPPIMLSATASSGLSITYESLTPGSLVGNIYTISSPGRETITAIQSGDDTYYEAPSVDQTFCIKPAQPVVTISNDNTAAPTLTSSASIGNQWYLDGVAIDGATDNTLAITSAGNYTVDVTADDCVSKLSTTFSIIVTGDINSSSSLALYPNPAHDFIFIKGVDESATTSCIDLIGRKISINIDRQGNLLKGDITNLTNGIYFIQVGNESQSRQIKFIKQ